MATKLFIGSLSFNTTEETLKELFSQYGEVETAFIVKDRETNRSRGFAFVEMADDDAAQTAIKELNDKEVDGRKIAVSVAREREDKPRPRQQGGFRKSW